MRRAQSSEPLTEARHESISENGSRLQYRLLGLVSVSQKVQLMALARRLRSDQS